jgi:hypothetical protein
LLQELARLRGGRQDDDMNSYFRIRVQNERINYTARESAAAAATKKFVHLFFVKRNSQGYMLTISQHFCPLFFFSFFPLFSLTAFFVYYMSLFHSFRGYNLKY